jgi:hypothetical protein
MQTRTHRSITKQRISDLHVERREEKTDVSPPSETEPARKPLVAFEPLPAPTALPLTWD